MDVGRTLLVDLPVARLIRMYQYWGVTCIVQEPLATAQVTAGYFTMKNKGGTQASVERVETFCCASVAMYQAEVSGDRVRMPHPGKLVVPAHATTSFQSRWPHLMLIKPSRALRHHETVDIEFYCAQGNRLIVEFELVTAR